MILTDNRSMLDLFATDDETAHFYDCHDIEMAGKAGYKIKKVEYYAENAGDILSSYVTLKTYADDSVTAFIHSKSPVFLEDVASLLLDYPTAEVDIASLTVNLREAPPFAKRFYFSPSDRGEPIYAIYSKAQLTKADLSEDVKIIASSPEFDSKITAEMLSYMEGYITESVFSNRNAAFSDTVIYYMLKSNSIIGYLRAERGYKNYYDIGWVEIANKFRGHGYGKQLVVYFSERCFEAGNIPHYGFAVSHESVMLARSCGYTETRPAVDWIKITKKAQ